MKKVALALLGSVMLAGILHAQNDTMYIMRSGSVIGKYNTTEIDSVIFYDPAEAGLKLTDIDGNVYKTVTIGTQTWMAENLRTTRYADGTPIPRVTGDANWGALSVTSQAYCWYDDDSVNYAGTYGALYTWAAAMKGADGSIKNPSAVQGVCPDGWHLPSNAESEMMESYLMTNGYNYDGTTNGNKIAKSLATIDHWNSSSVEGAVGNTDFPSYRNKSGFSATPGGYRDNWGTCNFLGVDSDWWSATEERRDEAWFTSINYFSNNVFRLYLCYYKDCGFSVRCVRD